MWGRSSSILILSCQLNKFWNATGLRLLVIPPLGSLRGHFISAVRGLGGERVARPGCFKQLQREWTLSKKPPAEPGDRYPGRPTDPNPDGRKWGCWVSSSRNLPGLAGLFNSWGLFSFLAAPRRFLQPGASGLPPPAPGRLGVGRGRISGRRGAPGSEASLFLVGSLWGALSRGARPSLAGGTVGVQRPPAPPPPGSASPPGPAHPHLDSSQSFGVNRLLGVPSSWFR